MRIEEKTIIEVKGLIDKHYDEIINIRRNLHKHPELSENEKRTSDLICNFLKKENISFKRSSNTNALVGIIKGKHPLDIGVGIRADMDALPIEEATNLPYSSVNTGVMHACGHDIHVATLLGTALVLSSLSEDFDGTVKLFFQPAEETCGGALSMIEEGCLQDPKIDYVIGLHIEPSLETGKVSLTQGTMNAASTEFSVTIEGKSCHAAHPENGIDPLIVACETIRAYQNIISKKLSPTKKGLITVSKFNCGTKNNIISGKAVYSGIIRANSLSDRELIKREVLNMTEGISEVYGTTSTIDFQDSYPNLVNDDSLFAIVKGVAESALGTENLEINNDSSMGADDFSYFTHASKGLYFNLGCLSPDDTEVHPLHSALLNPHEASIKTGILIEVLSSLEILNGGY